MIVYLSRRLLYIARRNYIDFSLCFDMCVQQYKLSISPTEYHLYDK